MIDSDPISEGTPHKRRRLDYTQPGKKIITYTSDDDSGDELFKEYEHETIPTQPLSQYKKPISSQPQRLHGSSQARSQMQSQSQSQSMRPTQPKPGGGLFAQTMSSLQQSSVPFQTQPTQPLARQLHPRSSPEVEVLASSPMKPSPARPISSMMAPPGTAFRRPGTVATQTKAQMPSQSQRTQTSQDLAAAFDDPPIEPQSDDDEDDLHAGIRSTTFVRNGGSRNLDSQESSGGGAFDVSRFAYNQAADDMSSAYGSSSRRSRPSSKQAGPARAQPVQDDMDINGIRDFALRDKIERMRTIMPTASVRMRYDALVKKKGNYDDACDYLIDLLEKGEGEGSGSKASDPIELESSDIENNKRPLQPLAPRTKHEVHTTQSIREKYTVKKKPEINREVKRPEPELITSSPPPVPKKRGKLVKGRKKEEPPEEEEDVDEGIKLPEEISSDDSEAEPEPDYIENSSLLTYFNDCSAIELADLANEKVETAEFVLSHRPFKNLDQIREITQTSTTKTGKKGTRKNLGEKLVEVSEEMWEGYAAVDKLVEECKKRGDPILETMKRWSHSESTKGELDMTKLDDPHDSGIGTPSSMADDDIVSPVKKHGRGTLLKQPEIMSKDLTMKDYQVTGLNWLNLLWSKRLSCILADDMGLGKTCQVISFFAHLKETAVGGTHLVVVPGSTIENWLREFKRFCPDIEVQAYYGLQKEREELRYEIEENLDAIDVLVTTYDIAAKEEDNKFLRKRVQPKVCVFDEGHMLKNAESSRHKELSRFRPEFRLLLTGTPLQNNLQELISLLGFIMPDVFKDASENLRSIFKNKATVTDTNNAALLSTQRINRARAMLTPFILRRKKSQVLSILPAKIRRVQYCDMVPAQAKLWRKLIRQAKGARDAQEQAAKAPAKARKAAAANQTVHMMSLRFASLHPLLLRKIYTDTRLKQLQDILINNPRSEFRDNRPDLVWKYLTQDLKGGDFALHKFCQERSDFIPSSFTLQNEEWMTLSGKIPVLRDLLNGWIEAGSRALIFSQFTTMLDILESVLSTLGIRFVRLDGSTKMDDRQALIDAFTADAGIKVFMLSTKAGGAGINLAAADKVVILEGGFNPQDEIQAENRAHRVGQEREVEVVRLVTRGTVEEVILKVGEVKLRLDEAVNGDAASVQHGAEEVKGGFDGEDEGKKRVEDLFYAQIEEEEVDGSDTETEEEVEPGVEEVEEVKEEDQWEDRPRTRGKRGGRLGKSLNEDELFAEGDSEEEVKTRGKRKRGEDKGAANKKKKVAKGGDIGTMFRQGMRKRGVNVGK
ncbi:ATP-dependent helicase fft2-like protein [Elsinoe fawcettii]|nr:ATP-dependent helicase fft2-like protein [Elsinoe fawcettii]